MLLHFFLYCRHFLKCCNKNLIMCIKFYFLKFYFLTSTKVSQSLNDVYITTRILEIIRNKIVMSECASKMCRIKLRVADLLIGFAIRVVSYPSFALTTEKENPLVLLAWFRGSSPL